MATVAKICRGIKSDGKRIKPKELVVRFTHDRQGKESLPISDDKKIMLQVDFKGIEDLIRQARSMK